MHLAYAEKRCKFEHICNINITGAVVSLLVSALYDKYLLLFLEMLWLLLLSLRY